MIREKGRGSAASKFALDFPRRGPMTNDTMTARKRVGRKDRAKRDRAAARKEALAAAILL